MFLRGSVFVVQKPGGDIGSRRSCSCGCAADFSARACFFPGRRKRIGDSNFTVDNQSRVGIANMSTTGMAEMKGSAASSFARVVGAAGIRVLCRDGTRIRSEVHR